MSDFVYVIESREAIQFMGELDAKTEMAMVRALNKTAPHTRTQAARQVLSEVNFPASYLNPATKRLYVSQKATRASLQATITGRGRPTSLARFARAGSPLPGSGKKAKGGKINVEVKKGQVRPIKRAFLVSLPGSPDSRNLGLAVRTNGEKPRGAYVPKKFGKNLWLLYGPSVDQILYSARTNGGVISEIEDDTLNYLNAEFQRQLDLGMKR